MVGWRLRPLGDLSYRRRVGWLNAWGVNACFRVVNSALVHQTYSLYIIIWYVQLVISWPVEAWSNLTNIRHLWSLERWCIEQLTLPSSSLTDSASHWCLTILPFSDLVRPGIIRPIWGTSRAWRGDELDRCCEITASASQISSNNGIGAGSAPVPGREHYVQAPNIHDLRTPHSTNNSCHWLKHHVQLMPCAAATKDRFSHPVWHRLWVLCSLMPSGTFSRFAHAIWDCF